MENKYENLVVFVHFQWTMQNLVISRCYFADDGKEMYKNLNNACTSLLFGDNPVAVIFIIIFCLSWLICNQRTSKPTSCRLYTNKLKNIYTCILFNFNILYKFRFSDRLICTTWCWVVTRQPPRLHYPAIWCIFNTPLLLHHGFDWLSQIWCFQFCFSLCSVFNLIKNVSTLIACELAGFTQVYLFTNSELKIFSTTLSKAWWAGYWNFSFIVSELMQVNPDNSLVEYVNGKHQIVSKVKIEPQHIRVQVHWAHMD